MLRIRNEQKTLKTDEENLIRKDEKRRIKLKVYGKSIKKLKRRVLELERAGCADPKNKGR